MVNTVSVLSYIFIQLIKNVLLLFISHIYIALNMSMGDRSIGTKLLSIIQHNLHLRQHHQAVRLPSLCNQQLSYQKSSAMFLHDEYHVHQS